MIDDKKGFNAVHPYEKAAEEMAKNDGDFGVKRYGIGRGRVEFVATLVFTPVPSPPLVRTLVGDCCSRDTSLVVFQT